MPEIQQCASVKPSAFAQKPQIAKENRTAGEEGCVAHALPDEDAIWQSEVRPKWGRRGGKARPAIKFRPICLPATNFYSDIYFKKLIVS